MHKSHRVRSCPQISFGPLYEPDPHCIVLVYRVHQNVVYVHLQVAAIAVPRIGQYDLRTFKSKFSSGSHET